MNNKHKQDINTRKRERSNRKHERFVSRFEHPYSTSPPSTLWRISTKNNPIGSLGAAIPQRVHTRSLGLTSHSIIPARTTHASTLACRGRISTPCFHKNSKQ